MPQLYDVNLEGNSFEGSIPDLSSCTNLRFLMLANNRLTGVVPVSLVQNDKQIWQVSLENNWFQGPLPLFNKTQTPLVSLDGNGFCLNHSGPCDHRVTTLLQVADKFGYPFLLAKSWRGNNPCQGWDFIMCDNNGNIRTVNLTNLNLMGTISPAFQSLRDLYEVYLGGNKLSGSIPERLTTLQHLKILDVSNNNLSGNIPPFSNKVNLITAGNALLRQPHFQANIPSNAPLSPASIVDWSTLYQITISIARGLDYLHRGCNTRILHLDIKPQNILLDENFSPKIANFGLAKICKKDESIVSILGTRGTPGYIAPEMFSRMYGRISHKSDVYSYEMLTLDMIGRRKNYDTGESRSDELYFPDWIYKELVEGNICTKSMPNTEEENGIITKMTLVGLWRIQINASNRPSMSKVVEMLEGPLQSIPYPPKPVVSSPTRPPLQFSGASHRKLYETNSTEEVNGSIK
ncbi:hypothetical protein PIB30_010441 [Stylosanthes scabra]|uniref:Protein kinase domain-containing protein n=1 Tax=Stylosanthes scabra TaxID=79078 RepID=A0ABU6Y256_9FABA|nr:hypothetical protein [Stylosanthes scabra]